MDQNIEELVESLKSNPRFKILRNKAPSGVGSDGAQYWEFTELESCNLKILYGKEIILGHEMENEITVTDKREDVYVFCNSCHRKYLFKDKPIEKTCFDVEELKNYIDKNV